MITLTPPIMGTRHMAKTKKTEVVADRLTTAVPGATDGVAAKKDTTPLSVVIREYLASVDLATAGVPGFRAWVAEKHPHFTFVESSMRTALTQEKGKLRSKASAPPPRKGRPLTRVTAARPIAGAKDPRRPEPTALAPMSYEDLSQIKDLATRLGGVDNVKRWLDALGEIPS